MVTRILTTVLCIALTGMIGCASDTTNQRAENGDTGSSGNPDDPGAIDYSVDTGMDLPADCSACEAIDPDKG